MPYDVFISYPHQNKAVADAACTKLETQGIRCWIAPRDIPPGADWAGSIVEAIDNCRVMVLIFSGYTNRSRQVSREVQQAFDGEKPVVPFRIENVTPEGSFRYYMGSVHWLDALTPPLEGHLEKLLVSVRALVKSTVSDVDAQTEQMRREALARRLAEEQQRLGQEESRRREETEHRNEDAALGRRAEDARQRRAEGAERKREAEAEQSRKDAAEAERREQEAHKHAAITLGRDDTAIIGRWRIWDFAIASLCAVALAFFPIISTAFWTFTAELFMIYAIAALSVSFLIRYAGIASAGHALFFGTGAYVTALLQNDPTIASPAAVASTSLVGLVVAGAIAALPGIYATIATLVVGGLSFLIAQSLITDNGMLVGPTAHGFYTVFAFFSGSYVLLQIIEQFGSNNKNDITLLNALRPAAENRCTYGRRLIAVVISAGVCGLAGSLFAWVIGFIAPENFSLNVSILLLAMALVGGTHLLSGAILGAAFASGLIQVAAYSGINFTPVIGPALIIIALVVQIGLARVSAAVKSRLTVRNKY